MGCVGQGLRRVACAVVVQASVLQAWAGKEENFPAAVDVAGALAKYVTLKILFSKNVHCPR